MPIDSASVRSRKAAVVVAAALALGLPQLGLAEIYGWIDGAGVVTYSNLPPPAGAMVTEVIPEPPPLSAKARAEEQHRIEVDELRDRVRLLELEQARSQRTVIDYPAAPVAPAGVGCSPGAYDCASDFGAYYGGGLLLGSYRPYRAYAYSGRAAPGYRGGVGARGAPAASSRGSGRGSAAHGR